MVQAAASLPQIQAALNYLASMREKPVTYAYAAARRSVVHGAGGAAHDDNPRPPARRVGIDVGRSRIPVPGPSKHGQEFRGRGRDQARLLSQSIALLKRVTGASEVRVFDHTLRPACQARTIARRNPAFLASPPPVHVDQTAASGVSHLRIEYPDEADALLRRRVAIVNLWRPIKSPVLDAPLAVCDARSVAPQDLVASDLVFWDRRGETYNLIYNPGQRWFYAPQMRPDEVLLLKCFDSRDDGGVARFAPHTAFIDPTAPEDAPPRESIELRTFVIFGEDGKAGH